VRLAATLVASLALAALTAAGAESPGKVKARMCASCHGPLGVSVVPDAPHLAGQTRFYLVKQLKAFRDGSRKHAVMSLMAKSLTDEEIEALADWYSSVLVEVKEPPAS
jgi:cytochrome c553